MESLAQWLACSTIDPRVVSSNHRYVVFQFFYTYTFSDIFLFFFFLYFKRIFFCRNLPNFTHVHYLRVLSDRKERQLLFNFQNLNSKTDTFSPQKSLKVKKKVTTDPNFKIELFTTYSNPQSGVRSPVKLNVRGENVFSTSTPKNS